MLASKGTVKSTTRAVVTKDKEVEYQQIQKELEKIGLSHTQAKIYVLLVRHRELRIQEITKLANIPRSSVYENLEKLYELGIAEEIVDDTFKRIRPYSLGIITHGLDEKLLRLKQVTADLHKLERNIAIAPSNQSTDMTILRYYKNRSGARQIFWNSLKATNVVYVYSDWGRRRYVGMKYYENFVTESRKRSIKERVLINMSADTLKSIQMYSYPGSPISRTRIEDIRVLHSKRVPIKGDTLMYGNIYAHIYLKNITINGFEIENNHFVNTQRSIFESLWDSAMPVTEFL